ncbi:MAG: 1,4-alpha-glucan branching protein GlgB [candidate division KSB1 bacterium]|nr:1,4-alpha-glucan branching protein GlgB [candidate division KSB1 bacterium]
MPKVNDLPNITKEKVEQIVHKNHHDPFQILGPHQIEINGELCWLVRAWLPNARTVSLYLPEAREHIDMVRAHHDQFFEGIVSRKAELPNYQFHVLTYDDKERFDHDSYFFLPYLTDTDLYLFGKGDHHKLYEKMGAHPTRIDDVEGVHFAVWAPNARAVSVVGEFNQWQSGHHQMRVLGGSGVWELFIPGLKAAQIYKYAIKDQHDHEFFKADPFAFQAETRPKTASIIAEIDSHEWNDDDWMHNRRNTDALRKPISIYEVHLGSWKRKDDNSFLNYRDLAVQLVDYVKKMGYTHIELMPVAEHPFDGSWGYQITGYFAPSSRYGAPADFQFFMDHCHQNDIGVIVDWVPAHFPKDAHGLARFDGTALYEHQDPRLGEHKDWGTLIFNYGRNEVRNFLIANALFWFDKYHIDGIRVDAVSSMLYLDYSREGDDWVANKFGGRENLDAIDLIKHINELLFGYFPGALSVAEESTAWPGVSKPTYLGGLGFNLKWNMGWMNDFLTFFSKDPVHRKYHHNMITFALLYAFNENFVLVLSHDEVVHGKKSLLSKMPGDDWQKFANLRALYGFMFGHPGKKLLFMGSELAQWREWNEKYSIDWHLLEYDRHRQIQTLLSDLNHLYASEPALYHHDFEKEGFQWIDFQDWENSIISFIRKGSDADKLIFVCNFTPVYREGYRVGAPVNGKYKELLNTDSDIYGGSNKGNFGTVQSQKTPWHGFDHSIAINLPPLATVIFKPEN